MSVIAERRPARKAVHLEVIVVFTNTEATTAALRSAGELANRLNGRITMIVPQVVSYQLPIDQTPVRPEWNRQHFREMAKASPVETTVRFCLCRDSWQALRQVLKPNSLIVVGGKKRLWSTAWRLARKLRQQGHEVILTERD